MTGERILVVDDGADMRDFVINYVLKPNGFDYREAHDGLEGFDLIISDPPDLILLDLQMPRLDGIGLLKKMREEEIDIPVVLMTFFGSEDIAIEVFRLGVRDYVRKPFTDDEMLDAIERALIETRLRRERDTLRERLVTANRDLERRVHDLEALYKVGKTVAGQTEEDALVTHIIKTAAQVTEARESALWLLDDDGQSLISCTVKSGDGAQLTRQPVENSLARQAIASGQAAVGDPQLDDASQKFTVQVCMPVIAGKAPLGVLTITTVVELVSEHQLDVLGALADYTAIGLDRARLAAALKEV